MKKIEIKHRHNGTILHTFTPEDEDEGKEVEEGPTDASSERTNPRRLDLRGADLTDLSLDGADLRGAVLRAACLSGADLTGAYLGFAYLGFAYLTGANLSGVDLAGAYLIGSKLSGADLSGLDLSGLDLEDADLSRTNLSRANLSGANLDMAIFYGADLRGAILNWELHELVAAILATAAGEDPDRLALAGEIRANPYDPWEDILVPDEPLADWAIATLIRYIRENDNAPDLPRSASGLAIYPRP
jgi:uncharacterized protein YjbI with pentapeptide repeats